jgi:formate dehydrogenase iron-sulfur subunit
MMSKGVLVDLTRCMGCRSCQVACKAWNDNSAELTLCLGCYDNPPDFSPITWSLIRFDEVEQDSKLHWVFTKRQCMHCEEPGCVSVCTVGALEKTPQGPVIYHSNKCIGCRYCQYGCPFGVPRFEWDKPLGLIRKCTFCVDRQSSGYEPACVKACPTDALVYGEREELLTQARARIAARPDKYVNHVYGENEVGGTSWLYISPVPFEDIGFPTLEAEPVAHAAEIVMNATPVTITAVVAGLLGLRALAKRRDEGLKRKKEGKS